MKRYIAAILIPCLLLQIFGCYSYREVTMDELKKYNGKEDVKIITEQTEFILNKDSTEKNKLNWAVTDSSIIMQEKTSLRDKYDNSTSNKKNEIYFKEIKSISINEPDSGETGLILGGVIISTIIVGFIVLLFNAKPSFTI
jgi:hypothetical protein